MVLAGLAFAAVCLIATACVGADQRRNLRRLAWLGAAAALAGAAQIARLLGVPEAT